MTAFQQEGYENNVIEGFNLVCNKSQIFQTLIKVVKLM